LFSDLKAVLIGEGAVQILSFFFRPDRNDKSAFETLNSFIKKLNSSE